MAWSQLQTAEERLEQVTQELGVARIKLTEAEQNLGVVGTQLLEKENQLQVKPHPLHTLHSSPTHTTLQPYTHYTPPLHTLHSTP